MRACRAMEARSCSPRGTSIVITATTAELNVTSDRSNEGTRAPAYQAYRLLHWAFVVAPVIAGVHQFFDLLTHWDKYLAPSLLNLSPLNAARTMDAVGFVEIIAGLVVALRRSVPCSPIRFVGRWDFGRAWRWLRPPHARRARPPRWIRRRGSLARGHKPK